MKLEDFVALATVPDWVDRRPAVVAMLEPQRESIEAFTGDVDVNHPAAPGLVRAMWNRLEENDPSIHRRMTEIGGGGLVT